MREQEISLVELAWKVIAGWRIWLVFGIVFAVLVPAVMYMRNERDYQGKIKSPTQIEMEQAAGLLTQEEKLSVENVFRIQKRLKKGRTYLKKSILMHLNPYEVDELVLTYSVKKSKNAPILADALTAYVTSEMDKEQIFDGIIEDKDSEYLDELISASKYSGDSAKVKTVEIKVYGRNQEELKKVESRMQAAMEKKIRELEQKEPETQILLLSTGRKTAVDSSLYDTQQGMQGRLDADTQKITELTANFNEQQKSYLDGLGKTDEETADDNTAVKTSGISKKYIVLGGALGVFFGMCCIACAYILSGRLRDAEELASGFGLRQHGVITKDGKKKGIDALIEKLRNRKRVMISEPEAWELAAGNVRLYCKKNEIKHLFITGTELSKLEDAGRAILQEKLSEQNIEVSFGGNINYDNEALDKAAGCDGVLLIEQVGESRYEEMEKQMQTLQNQNMNIIGCITIA